MTFRDFLTGCWLAGVIIILVGISYLYAAGHFQWLPLVVLIAIAICVPLIRFAVGIVIDKRVGGSDDQGN